MTLSGVMFSPGLMAEALDYFRKILCRTCLAWLDWFTIESAGNRSG